jgi:DNA segregation ATPase FtsK/SpoIIIE-like protein
MNRFFLNKNRLLWCIGATFYCGVIIFVMITLVSYNPTDSSWLYVSTDPEVVSNYGGFLGAQLAAYLFYLLGGASFLLFIPLIILGWIIFVKKTIQHDWERLCASLYIVFVGAALLATYYIDCAVSPYPGGLLGLRGAQILLHYFDPLGRILFLYSTLCASIILIFQWLFMCVVQLGMYATVQLYLLMKKYRVAHIIARVIGKCAYVLSVRFPIVVTQFVVSLLNGTVFDTAGMLHPEDEYTFADDNDFSRSSELWQDNTFEGSHVTDSYNYNDIKINYAIVSLSSSAPRYPSTGSLLRPILRSKLRRTRQGFVGQAGRAQENEIRKLKNEIVYLVISLPPQILLQKNHVQSEHKHTNSTPAHTIKKSKTTPTLTKKAPQYALPHMDIFIAEKHSQDDRNIEKELQERAQVLQDKLKRFGVNGEVVAIKRGPVVTVFEYQPDIDTKLSKIIVLEDDLAMALQAMSIRIIAPIPGRSVVGFEVSNTTRHDVLFSQITRSPAYTQFSGSLPLVLGKDTIGDAVVVDLARMPHLLIAGSTGSGKSVALNAVLISLLCKLSPDELKLILIDPKRLEFAAFTDIAHLLFPIVTSPVYAAPVLRWVVQEMEERYENMAQCGARNINDYNERIRIQDERDKESKPFPYIVVVIDELADLMITAGRDIEDLITRITQMARAAGIHMIVATQRPSVDVITGLIKANFPSRISFRVASRIDSRTILDTMGADRLLGRGDMLFLDAATSQLKRVHGAYVSDKEIEQVADHIRAQKKVEYLDMQQVTALQGQDMATIDDVLYKDVREFLGEIDEVSISLLQRKFRIGYNRSARIIEMLEAQGLIMPQDGGKTRKVIR